MGLSPPDEPVGSAARTLRGSGRRWEFADHRTGQKRFKRAVAGFDEAGFWVKARGLGWFSGPAKPVHVPWDAVVGCPLLGVRLINPPVVLQIHDQRLLDACERHVARSR